MASLPTPPASPRPVAAGPLPVVTGAPGLPPGEPCHFVAPGRYGRRRSDQFGHLLLTAGWLKFHGTLEVSLAWSEVADVQRAGADLIVTLEDSQRSFLFSCQSTEAAARGGGVAEHLRRLAHAPTARQRDSSVQSAFA